MRIYSGLPGAVHRHWLQRMRDLDPVVREKSVLLVPDVRLEARLGLLSVTLPRCLVLDNWLAHTLPPHRALIPAGTWELLSTQIPERLVSKDARQTPGYLSTVADVVRRARSVGIEEVRADVNDRLPWAAIWDWFSTAFSGDLVDSLRLYDYAEESALIPACTPGCIFVYGFAPFHAPLRRLVESWNRQSDVEVWTLSGLDRGAWSDTQPLEQIGDGSDNRYFVVQGDDGADGLDLALHVIQSAQWPDDGLVVETDRLYDRAWTRALARAQLGVDDLYPEEESRWRLFRAVLDPSCSRTMIRTWLKRVPKATEAWLAEWRRRAMELRAWGEAAVLLDEAADRHQAAWESVRLWGRSIRAWDVLAPVGDGGLLPFLQEAWPEPCSVRVLPLEIAIWVPSRAMLICGNPVRPPRLTPFDRDGALRAWIRDADASGRERRIVHMLSQPNGLTLWQVGEALGSLSDKPRWENWTVKLPREPVGIGQGLVLWYRAWRECGSFSAFTGRVDGMLAQQLLDERLSPSALEDFGRCPLAFLLGRVLGVQERERDDADQVLPTTSGQWAHRALELMVQRRLTVTVEHVRQCVSQAMREHPAPGRIPAFHLKYHQDRLTSEVYEVLLRDEWDPSLKSEVESALSWNWVWPLKGRIDRVDYLPDGTLRLVDYKSGYLANPDKPGPANLQLLLYQQALSNKTQRPVAAELVGISQRSEFTRRVVDPLKAQALTPVVSEIGVGMRQRLQSGEFFPIPDPRLDPCRRCAFELVCPARVADYARTKHAAAPAFAELWVGGLDDA